MRTITVQKFWVTDTEMEVEDDATIEDIIDAATEEVNLECKHPHYPQWSHTSILENGDEIEHLL